MNFIAVLGLYVCGRRKMYELLVAVGSTPNLDAFASPNESRTMSNASRASVFGTLKHILAPLNLLSVN